MGWAALCRWSKVKLYTKRLLRPANRVSTVLPNAGSFAEILFDSMPRTGSPLGREMARRPIDYRVQARTVVPLSQAYRICHALSV